jgi:hypothetical protein
MLLGAAGFIFWGGTREAQPSSGGHWTSFLVLMLPGAPGLFVLNRLRRHRRLASEGLPAAGVVTKRYDLGRGSGWIRYQFQTQNGSAAYGLYKLGLDVGATICVVYLAGNPWRNMPYLKCWYRVAQ